MCTLNLITYNVTIFFQMNYNFNNPFTFPWSSSLLPYGYPANSTATNQQQLAFNAPQVPSHQHTVPALLLDLVMRFQCIRDQDLVQVQAIQLE